MLKAVNVCSEAHKEADDTYQSVTKVAATSAFSAIRHQAIAGVLDVTAWNGLELGSAVDDLHAKTHVR